MDTLESAFGHHQIIVPSSPPPPGRPCPIYRSPFFPCQPNSCKANRASWRSSNSTVRSLYIWYVSWPFPAITTLSPPVAAPIATGWRPAYQDFYERPPAVFSIPSASVPRSQPDPHCADYRPSRLRYQPNGRRSPIKAACYGRDPRRIHHTNHPFGRKFPRPSASFPSRRGMGIVDQHGKILPAVNPLHPARHTRHTLQTSLDSINGHALDQPDGKCRQSVIDIEPTGQRQRDRKLDVLGQYHKLGSVRPTVCGPPAHRTGLMLSHM